MKKIIITDKELGAVRQIRNMLMHKGYTPSVRELARLLGYRSPRSAAVIINSLISKRVLNRRPDGSLQLLKSIEADESQGQTVNVPLIGMIACGSPVLAEENIEAMIPVSIKLAKRPHRHFLLRAKGDSMDKAGINNGDMILVQQQQAAENGDNIVALIDGEATIKEFHRRGSIVILKPNSTNKSHKPIFLTSDFLIQGVVVAVIPES